MKYLVIIAAVLFLSSCDCGNNGVGFDYPEDTFIFGGFAGECSGEKCIVTYMLQNGKLYEDINQAYPDGTTNNINWKRLDDDKYQMVKSVSDFFPSELFNEEAVIGKPDYYDQGGLIVGKVRDGFLHIWRFDTLDENIPEYLREYNDYIGSFVILLR